MHHTVPALLTPEQVGILRQLGVYARQAGYQHDTYRASADSPVLHQWDHGEDEVVLYNGGLTYKRQGTILLQAAVATAEQAAELLAAFGVIPVEMSPAYRTGQMAAAADIDAMLPYERDHETPAGGPLPAGVDGHPISGRDGGAR